MVVCACHIELHCFYGCVLYVGERCCNILAPFCLFSQSCTAAKLQVIHVGTLQIGSAAFAVYNKSQVIRLLAFLA